MCRRFERGRNRKVGEFDGKLKGNIVWEVFYESTKEKKDQECLKIVEKVSAVSGINRSVENIS